MAFNLRNFLEEKIADVNPFDGGKTGASVRSARRPRQTPQRSSAYGPAGEAEAQGLIERKPTVYAYKPAQSMIGSILDNPQRDPLNKFADVADYMNNKTYGSVLRAGNILSQGLRNIPTRIGEALNPDDEESHGDRLLDETDKKYGFTDTFRKQLRSSNPVLTSEKLNSSGLNNSAAAGLRWNDDRLHRIQVGNSRDKKQTLFHEGLHDVYDTLKDESRMRYFDLVNRALGDSKPVLGPKEKLSETSYRQEMLVPDLRTYLMNRTHNYRGHDDAGWKNMQYVPEHLRNEVHSYVPEYYETYKQPMPTPLRDYYANYYNTGGRPMEIQRKNGIEQLMERILGEF